MGEGQNEEEGVTLNGNYIMIKICILLFWKKWEKMMWKSSYHKHSELFQNLKKKIKNRGLLRVTFWRSYWWRWDINGGKNNQINSLNNFNQSLRRGFTLARS